MSQLFYGNGLFFECTQYSNYCRLSSDNVFLSYNDFEYFTISKNLFIKRYCRIVVMNKNLSLIEKPNNNCIFWSNGECEIYTARPFQCSSYPFWKSFFSNKKLWNIRAQSCPEMNNGVIIDKVKIEE